VDRLLKYQDVLSPILEIATTASQVFELLGRLLVCLLITCLSTQLNPIAQAVMGSVNIIFEVQLTHSHVT
jgi:hypothetical protein